jgi:NAD(P)-dependent dehydrogenase (short-subunit alcohol dehydrogenase family)
MQGRAILSSMDHPVYFLREFLMEKKKSPRVWLITGCSTGFGRHLAEAALSQGDCVIVTARDQKNIQDLEKKYPKSAKIARLDVTDQGSIHEAIANGLDVFGKIDVVVNNAGFAVMGAVEELSERQIRAQFETNFFGVLNVTRAVLPVLRKNGSGHILNVSSVGGRLTVPSLGLYHASKFALEGLSEGLAGELKPFGIKVILLEPGGFETDFWGRSLVLAEPMPEYDFLRKQMANFSSGSARGEPSVGVKAILKVIELADPPLRLAIGPNALPRLIKKLTSDIEEYQRYEDFWRESTAVAPGKMKT